MFGESENARILMFTRALVFGESKTTKNAMPRGPPRVWRVRMLQGHGTCKACGRTNLQFLSVRWGM